MKEIKLTQGQVALVDDEDYDYLNQWKWYADKHKKIYYARNSKKGTMHRVVTCIPNNLVVDHLDHDGLNNQRANLRICTLYANSANTIQKKVSKWMGIAYVKSKYKNKIYKYIRAVISHKGKIIHLGMFKTEELAAIAYDNAAKKYRGDLAELNFK